MFYPGESLQFNAIHTTVDGFPEGEQYRIYWNLEFYDNAWTFEESDVAGGDFEVIHRPLINTRAIFNYGGPVTHNWWWFDSIPTLPADPPVLSGTKGEVLESIVDGSVGQQVFYPGLWTMKVFIRLLLDEPEIQLSCKGGVVLRHLKVLKIYIEAGPARGFRCVFCVRYSQVCRRCDGRNCSRPGTARVDQPEATAMSFINTISPAEARGEVRAMYASEEEDWGYVPDFAMVFCHRPKVMERWGELLTEIRRPVDARRIELATFVAAYELRHSPCSLAHGAKLAKIIGKEAVLAIAAGREDEVLDPADAAILRYARQVARDASKITAADIEDLRAHGLGDDEIFDIAANAASRCFLTKLLDALGADADSGLMKLDPDLRRALTVGRPISERPPETLAGTNQAV